MSTLTARPMSLVWIEFDELYARHLCRHSQFGINIAHLVALYGVWYAVYAALYSLTGTLWVPVALAVSYFLVLALNAPMRVLAVTALFLALLVGSVVSIPALPPWAFWAYLLPIPLFYKLQAWSHKVWNIEHDMTEFQKKYRKGFVLFVVLLFYEVPIVLNYLVFGPKRLS